ncbi:uncharacterized protein LOC128189772 [Crassostrea angulata]|uniref:uncharacterized protein LOC128189772 n=1 Tax=Magallana angulata TaxID=2784310 RepID=UPI0022B1B0C1|nr:uncharacterized protein LOC128189772 [Crassostrea angulata]
MKRCLILYCVVLQFIPDTMGVLLNSPCTKTSDWSNYNILRCPTNHTIYITKHVIEDGFTKLAFPSLGCSDRDAVYCGVELPTNNINLKNYHILDSAAHTCNRRNECNLTKQYFLKAEAALKKFCNASLRPELQNATFRQSIDYECIQDSQVMDMCLTGNESRHSYQPVYLKALGANCTCSLTGPVSRVKILQTKSVKILIQSNDSNLLEHQNTNVGLYGIDIPVQADNLFIRIQEGSNNGFVLMTVLSKENLDIRCYKNRILQRSLSTVHTPRIAFQIEMTMGTSLFTQSKTGMFIETTSDDQVPVFKEKIESSDVAFNQGVLIWIQTFSIIFLSVFAFFIYYKKRTAGHNSVEIRIKDKQEKLILVCYPKDEKKKTSIEIHQADCMCASNNERKETASPYTPLQIVNEVEVNNQTSNNNDYLDVI